MPLRYKVRSYELQLTDDGQWTLYADCPTYSWPDTVASGTFEACMAALRLTELHPKAEDVG